MSTNELNIYTGATSIPPHHNHASADVHSTMNRAVRGQLVKHDDNDALVPGLLESFDYDNDKKGYLLVLKSDLKFHNGRNVTSTDLEFSLTRGFYSKTSNFFNTYFSDIQGIDAVTPGESFSSGKITGVQVIDDKSVLVRLTTPNPEFLNSLTPAYFSLAPIEALDSDYMTWKDLPVGAGDFKATSYEGGVFNLKYLGKKQLSFESVNLINKRPENLNRIHVSYEKQEFPFQEKFSEKSSVNRLLMFSSEHPLSKNLDFKKAIHFLIDREAFGSQELGIEPLEQLLAKHFYGRVEKTLKPNLQLAKQHLDKVPKELLKSKIQIGVFAGAEVTASQKFYRDAIAQQFRSLNLEVEFKANEEKFRSKETAKKFPLYFVGQLITFTDPLIPFSGFRKSGHNQNYLPLQDTSERYEELYLKAQNSSQVEKKAQRVKELGDFTLENCIVLALSEEKDAYSINTNIVQTIGSQSLPPALQIEKIIIK